MGTRSTTGHSFILNIAATISNALDDSASAAATLNGSYVGNTLSNGVEANQISRAWVNKSLEISASSSVDLDVADVSALDIGAGSGVDALGQDVVMEEIVLLVIKNKSTSAGYLEINSTLPSSQWGVIPQYAARNAVGGALKPGGVRIWFEPDAQALDTAGSGAEVRLTATGGDVTAEIYIFGRHDDEASSSSSGSSSSSSSSSQSTSSLSSTSTSSS